jgi:hypothetical protein
MQTQTGTLNLNFRPTYFPTFSIQKDNQPTQQQQQLRKTDELFSHNCEDEQKDDEWQLFLSKIFLSLVKKENNDLEVWPLVWYKRKSLLPTSYPVQFSVSTFKEGTWSKSSNHLSPAKLQQSSWHFIIMNPLGFSVLVILAVAAASALPTPNGNKAFIITKSSWYILQHIAQYIEIWITFWVTF